MQVLALDIGGTKIDAGVVDGDGTIIARRRRPTSIGRDGDELFDEIAQLLDGVEADSGPTDVPRPLGVGVGGPMTSGGRQVSPLNIPAWRDFPLLDRLSARFGRPVVIDNDAKALTVAEGWLGAARGLGSYLGMVVSTGVGGGLVVDGRLLDGVGGNAGHIGHIVVEPDGRQCVCGARGCLEALASGTAIAAISGRPAAEADSETRRRTGMWVGRAVASVVTVTAVERVVVAGSVALGFGDEFFDAANVEFARCARLPYTAAVSIVPAGCGADGPLLGAAALALGARDAAAPGDR